MKIWIRPDKKGRIKKGNFTTKPPKDAENWRVFMQQDTELARLEQITRVECQNQPVKIGDWFVCSYGSDTPIGKCTQILPTGLMLAFRWGDLLLPSQHFLTYDRILGRAEVGWLKRLIG